MMNIKQVSIEKNISADTLRYYERIGLIPPVNRTAGGIRDYDTDDLGWVDFTICMRNAGLPIEALIEYNRLYQMGQETIPARRNLLVEEREHLLEKRAAIEETLTRLDKKIALYDQDLHQ